MEKGRTAAFGLVADPKGFSGVGILEPPDDADAAPLTAADPTIKSGRGFRYEIHAMPRAAVQK